MNSQSLLDEMVNEDSVRILKAAIPYLPSKGQSFACVFAKFLELQNTLNWAGILLKKCHANLR